MPIKPKLKTMFGKLRGILLGDESWLCTVAFGALGLIILIWLADSWLRGTRFEGPWVEGLWAPCLAFYVVFAAYVYFAFRGFVWLRNFKRGLPAYIQHIKDDFNGKIRHKTPEMEAEEAAETVKLRSVYLFAGVALLLMVIHDNPVLVSLSFAVGLLGAFLMSGRDLRDNSREKTRTFEIGRLVLSGIRSKVYPHEIGVRVFVLAMTVYIFYFLDTSETLLGWGSGFVCGYATFNDNWRGLIAQWPTMKKEIRSIVSIKKSPGKKD